MAHNAVLEENRALKAQLANKAETSKKDKGKGKSVSFAALPMARIDEVDDTNSIINQIETTEQFRARTFVTPKSQTSTVPFPTIPEDTEMVSLGDETEAYQNMSMEEEEALYFPKYDDRDGDYIKYGDGLQ